MPETGYSKYVVQDLKAPFSPEVNTAYSKIAKRILWIDDKVVPGAFQMNCSWNNFIIYPGILKLMKKARRSILIMWVKFSAFSEMTRMIRIISMGRWRSGWVTRNLSSIKAPWSSSHPV